MNKFYCKCSKCGKEVEVDTSNGIVLTSNQPITVFRYECDNCGNKDTVEENAVYGVLKINKEPVDISAFFIPCLICGKQVTARDSCQQYVVCDECKDDIKKLKSIISTNEKMGRRFDTDEEQDWSDAFKLTCAQEKMSMYTFEHKPSWCDEACCCAECKKAIECARRYNISEAIDLAAKKIYQDTKNMEIK